MNEIKKEENIFSDDFKKNLKNFWNLIIKNIKNFWNWLSDIGIKKIIGIFIVVLTGSLAFIEFLGYVFVSLDREKFSEIVQYFYNFKIFDYLSVENFYALMAGGFLMDIANYGFLILLGLWLWKKKNYFKVNNIGWILVGILALGLTIFSFGFYKSMPQIMIPLEKVSHKIHFEKDNERNWKKDEKKFHHGYNERIFFDDGNEERFFQYINTQF